MSDPKTILLVDDDADVRSALNGALTREGFTVIEAADGVIARDYLEKNQPTAIISDIRMPNMDGSQLLAHVRKQSQLPFLLMTGSSEILETQDALRLGASEFILKPFKRDELIAALTIALEPAAPTTLPPKNLDFDFCRLSIDEFVSGRSALTDIYVRMSETRYIKIGRTGSELSSERIKAYKAKGLNFLYIKNEDFAKYIGFNLGVARAASGNKDLSKFQRVRLLKHTSEAIVQDAFINGVARDRLEVARALVESIVSVLTEDVDLLSLLENLQTHADYLYAHSLGVALYSSMVAKHVGWFSGPTLMKIVMGGLLHDIGKKEIPREILEKPRHALSLEERQIYETHPIRGKDILSSVKTVPGDVILITMHHHENSLGRGYPYQVNKTKIHPLAKLVALVNEFCQLTVKSPGGEPPVSAHEALARLWQMKGAELDPAFLRALMEIFKAPIPDDLPRSSLPSVT